MIGYYICEVNSDPKKSKKRTVADFNPWEGKAPQKQSHKLSDNFSQLKHLASSWPRTQ